MKIQLILLCTFVFVACSTSSAKKAIASIESKNGSSASGTIVFSEEKGAVKIKATISGLGEGPVAIHLHSVGDCSSDDGKSAGGHWNPTKEDHGEWGKAPFHSGDIGNINVDPNGIGKLTLVDQHGRWSIGGTTETDIIGKSIIIHAGMDDMASQPSGAAGMRIGCAVIKKATD
ncbi:MAG: superoxide dismutase family protein [Candidatus Marinimicrobia bacterium]|nr:superoxide dismutase family protein [Candidatus Neomarinimicrobiota bacterium]